MIADTAETTSRPASSSLAAALDAIRLWGYLQADLDPLGRLQPTRNEALDELDLDEDSLSDDERQRLETVRRAYTGSLAVETAHIPDAARRRWIYERMEAEATGDGPDLDRERILEALVRGETFEQWLQARYLGTKRFSIEGVTALLPLLDETLRTAAGHGIEQAVLAMSHRGRLNVMLHTVGRQPRELLAGFEDVDPRSVLGSGDVKYHLGATGTFEAGERSVRLHLASNPSHLEAVDPVVLGRVRAKIERHRQNGGEESWKTVLPVIMHGDAAFAGQGILAESLNFADLPGFTVGGSIHVVVDNWIGFTTEPPSLWSWRFTTDVAKRLPVPIFHVNGEDPEAVVRVARMAVDYRFAFGSDVVVDMIGYRRHGHSEVDDPTITQPRLYETIESRPRLWEIYAENLGREEEARELAEDYKKTLDDAQDAAGDMKDRPKIAQTPPYWDDFHGGFWDDEYEVDSTGLDAATVAEIAERLTTVPDDFHLHDKVAKLLDQRREMGNGERPIDYGMAEALAFGSLVRDEVPVRLTGQDSRRATFAQRHSVVVDVETGEDYYPLQHISENQAFFQVYDSMLSEAAVLGFEYGFSRDYPEALVCWEAQFGDFANGGQIITDQFISAAEDKWGLLSGLTMLLPHGYEGQGPEHSSARVERFLQLCAEDNMQVAQPSTAAQYFHLLRRQALRRWRKPLVIFTPKSMLRSKDSASTVEDLGAERFQEILPDTEKTSARRVLVATGKILHELRKERGKRDDADAVAIVGVEQLYPFPSDELLAELDRLGPKEIVWVQEEPANMGALSFVLPYLERISRGRPVRSVKRSASASPATGSAKAHSLEQKTLLSLAFA